MRYRFQSAALQTTHPTSAVDNIGRQSSSRRLYTEGEVDQYAETLHLILKGYPMARRYVELQIADGRALGLASAEDDWQPIEEAADLFAGDPGNPLGAGGGDPLAFLVGGRLLGLTGLVLAVPLAAALQAAWEHRDRVLPSSSAAGLLVYHDPVCGMRLTPETAHTSLTDHSIPRARGEKRRPQRSPGARWSRVPLVHFHHDRVDRDDPEVRRVYMGMEA